MLDALDFVFAAAGAGVGALVNYLVHRKSRGERLDEFAAQMIRDENLTLKQENNMLESYNAGHVKKIAELEKVIFEIRTYNELLQAMPFDLPLPFWSVDRNHNFDYINQMYAELFLRPRGLDLDDCIGKNIYDVWPRNIADIFRQNNIEVMQNGTIFNGLEDVPDALGNVSKWRILKFKRKFPVGVIGIAIPQNGMFDNMLNKIK